jgi:hypothetical protein
MHNEVFRFASSIKEKFPEYFDSWHALDFGALNINGSIRSLFDNCTFTGIDWRPGPDVDVVSLAHEYNGQPSNVIISTEMLEHDPYWERSLDNMCHHLSAKHGMILISCANERRGPHCVETSPESGYYKGLLALDIHKILMRYKHKYLIVVNNDISNDVYAAMIR